MSTTPIPEAVLEALDDAAVITDGAGTILWASRRLLELFGYSAGEVAGRKLPRLLSWEARDSDAESTAATGVRRLEAFRKGGEPFPVEVRRVPLDEARTLVLVRDVTAIVTARARLREFTQAIETASSGVAIADRDLKLRQVNAALAGMFGIERQELLGQSLRTLFPAALAGHEFRDLVELRGLATESETRRRDGTPFPVEISFDPVLDEDGSAVGVVAIVQDISDRRRTAEALRVSEERYALAVRGAADGIWDWDLVHGRVYYSDRWQSLVGLAPGDVAPSPDEWFSRVHAEDLPTLTARLDRHLAGETTHFEMEHRVLHADGTYRWMLARGAAVWDETNRATRIAGSQTDITDRKVHDPLTGLPNRALFLDRVEQARAHARRQPKALFAVLFLDLDRFKVVNDSLGHSAGDQLLVQVARRIEACLRGGDTVARPGGDEFTILLEAIESPEEAMQVAQRIHDALALPFAISGHELFVTGSIGIALADRLASDLPGLVRDADTAMYRAKVIGRGRSQLFSGEMRSEMLARLQIETDLRRGLERDEFEVYYQPIVSLKGNVLTGFEALVRWHHPERGLLLPSAFITIAEETGAILPLGMWVLHEACRQLAQWRELEPQWADLSMSVNLSPRLFSQPDLVRLVREALEATRVPASALKLELTEGVLIAEPDEANRMLRELRQMGVGICLDDFGTGYSSLSYLNRFAIDVLKIDRSFVRELSEGGDKVELVRNIVRLGADLGLTVVAEGVETADQRRFLVDLDCELMQGFEFSRPLPAADVWALFHASPG